MTFVFRFEQYNQEGHMIDLWEGTANCLSDYFDKYSLFVLNRRANACKLVAYLMGEV